MGYDWSKVTEETAQKFFSMSDDEKRSFAVANNIAFTSVNRRLRELKERFKPVEKDRNTLTHDDYLVLETDNVLIISDTEFPDTDMKWIDRVLQVGKQNNITQLIWAGDIFAFDYAAITRHPTRDVKKSMTMAEVVDFVKDVQDDMSAQFTEQYAIGSNHDDRFNIALGGGLNIGHLLPRIKYYPHDYCYIQTSAQGLIKVIHPDGYSATPVSMLHKFYNAEQGPYFDSKKPYDTLRKCHFVCAHTHITSFSYSADGAHKLISIGTLRDPNKTQYYMQSQTGLPKWSASFASVINGQLNLVT